MKTKEKIQMETSRQELKADYAESSDSDGKKCYLTKSSPRDPTETR